jgi:hypothetical protein
LIESNIIAMTFVFFVGVSVGIMFWGWATSKEHPHERVGTRTDGIKLD